MPPIETIHSLIAQLVEQRTVNPCVPGSSPGQGAIFGSTTLKGRSKSPLASSFRAFLLSDHILPDPLTADYLWGYFQEYKLFSQGYFVFQAVESSYLSLDKPKKSTFKTSCFV
jgi:hypothetical protein